MGHNLWHSIEFLEKKRMKILSLREKIENVIKFTQNWF